MSRNQAREIIEKFCVEQRVNISFLEVAQLMLAAKSTQDLLHEMLSTLNDLTDLHPKGRMKELVDNAISKLMGERS